MRSGPIRLLAVLSVAAVALAGCGGSDDPQDGGGESTNEAGSLSHVDGMVSRADEGFTLTPINGDAAIDFQLGPELEGAEIRAIEASGEPARVSYREAGEEPVAAAISPAPKLGEGVEAYQGTVTSVDDAKLVIDGPDGDRTFDISGADEGAFDTTHLRDHAKGGEPIKVYFDPSAPDAGLAYEDA